MQYGHHTTLHTVAHPTCACRYAELNGDTRSFTPEEEDLFDRSAEFAYASFRDKAAESRRMPKDELQKHAQGRVWSGKRALQIGLIDGLGGVERAISIAKQEAGIGKQALFWGILLCCHSEERLSWYSCIYPGGWRLGRCAMTGD